ncbi:MAG: HEAT repeat domain-containing protein [Desulfosalsimonadaceae bacterium]
MVHSTSIQKAVNLLFTLNGATTNIRLYPSESAMVKSGKMRVYQLLTEILETEESLEFAEAEAKLLIQGDALREKLQKSDRVHGFTSMMVDLGINCITFQRGIDETELADFLQILARSSEEIHADGGLPALIEHQNILHVKVDEKIYTRTDGRDKHPPPGAQGEDPAVSELKEGLLVNALKRIAASDLAVFKDGGTSEALPDAFAQLVGAGKKKIIAMLLKRMESGLAHDDPEIRKSVAATMVKVDEKLEETGHTGLRLEVSKILSGWAQAETEAVNEFELVANRMGNLVRRLVASGKAENVGRIIESYDRIARGELKRKEAIHTVAQNMIEQLAEEELLDDLMAKTFKKTGEEDLSSQKEDIETLVNLGSKNLERLFERLRDSSDMTERNRIIQTITQIGTPALPEIVQQLKHDGPWYYSRNLLLLLGRLGDENHVPTLERFLVFQDYRVQREAIKSIQALGGKNAGRILRDNFEYVDPQLQAYVISVIGALHYEPAVPWLIELLSSDMPMQKNADRDEIREKACEALGRMKAEQAISVLDSIIRKKKFFGKKEPESIRSAAVRALSEIKR